MLSLREAATAAGVSLSTIRRRHRVGTFQNARKDGEGRWLIPVNDLLAAGFRLNTPDTPATEAVNDGHEPPDSAYYRRQAEAAHAELRHQLKLEQMRAEHAERLADERLRMIDHYERALRILEAAPEARGEPVRTAEPEQPHGRSWFRRRR